MLKCIYSSSDLNPDFAQRIANAQLKLTELLQLVSYFTVHTANWSKTNSSSECISQLHCMNFAVAIFSKKAYFKAC